MIDDQLKARILKGISGFPPALDPIRSEELARDANMSRRELMPAMLDIVRERAFAPISDFAVGAVGLSKSGALFPGVNLEFPGLSLSYAVHAEQAVVMNAVTAVDCREELEALAVSAPPCGFCRQFLYELSSAQRLRLLIPERESRLLTDFLPEAFGPEDLGNRARLLRVEEGVLDLMDPEVDWKRPTRIPENTWNAALACARESYAPYTGTRAGVALRLRSGEVFRGLYIENAAFNPSISPMAGALSNLRVAGCAFNEIESALLLESSRGISQREPCEIILASVANVKLITFRDGEPA